MGVLALLMVLIQPTHAVEGTYIYRGGMDAPYHSISFSPIKSLTHLAQTDKILKYQADQTVILDGRTYTSAVYTESPDVVTVSIGEPSSKDYHEFRVGDHDVKEIAVVHSDSSPKNILASVKVKN